MVNEIDKKTIRQVAAGIGLDKIYCTCGRTVDAVPLLDELFLKIIRLCRQGYKVSILKFGVFKAVEYSYNNVSYFRFRFFPAKIAKDILNKRNNRK